MCNNRKTWVTHTDLLVFLLLKMSWITQTFVKQLWAFLIAGLGRDSAGAAVLHMSLIFFLRSVC